MKRIFILGMLIVVVGSSVIHKLIQLVSIYIQKGDFTIFQKKETGLSVLVQHLF